MLELDLGLTFSDIAGYLLAVAAGPLVTLEPTAPGEWRLRPLVGVAVALAETRVSPGVRRPEDMWPTSDW